MQAKRFHPIQYPSKFWSLSTTKHDDFSTDGYPRRPRTPGTGVRTIDSKFQCSSSPPAEKQEACALVTDGSPSRPRTPGTGVRTIIQSSQIQN